VRRRPATLREVAGWLRRLTHRELPQIGLELHRRSHRDFARRIPPRIPVLTGRAKRGFRDLGEPSRLGETSEFRWSATAEDGFDYAVLVLEPGRRPRKQTRERVRKVTAGVMIGSKQAPKGVFGPAVRWFRRGRLRRIADRLISDVARRMR